MRNRREMRSNRVRRIDEILASLLKQKKWRNGLFYAHIAREWPLIVGREIASHAQPTHFTRGRLDVACDHDVWRAELQYLKPELLARLSEALGEGVVKEIWLK
jgi:predicted nucleic acid-binding Zn ribbon protein